MLGMAGGCKYETCRPGGGRRGGGRLKRERGLAQGSGKPYTANAAAVPPGRPHMPQGMGRQAAVLGRGRSERKASVSLLPHRLGLAAGLLHHGHVAVAKSGTAASAPVLAISAGCTLLLLHCAGLCWLLLCGQLPPRRPTLCRVGCCPEEAYRCTLGKAGDAQRR